MKGKSLNIELRKESGKNISRRMRQAGYIPGVVYSHGESELVKIQKKDFTALFKDHISESVIFELHYKGKKENDQMAFIKEYQADPVTGDILHLDLFKVTAGEKIQTLVPIKIVGSAVGVNMGGILESGEREIEVECLPKDLPEEIEVDVSMLDIGDSIHVKDLKLGDTIQIMTNAESVIAAVHLLKVAVEEEEVEEELVEGEEGEEVAAKDDKDAKEAKDVKEDKEKVSEDKDSEGKK